MRVSPLPAILSQPLGQAQHGQHATALGGAVVQTGVPELKRAGGTSAWWERKPTAPRRAGTQSDEQGDLPKGGAGAQPERRWRPATCGGRSDKATWEG